MAVAVFLQLQVYLRMNTQENNLPRVLSLTQDSQMIPCPFDKLYLGIVHQGLTHNSIDVLLEICKGASIPCKCKKQARTSLRVDGVL